MGEFGRRRIPKRRLAPRRRLFEVFLHSPSSLRRKGRNGFAVFPGFVLTPTPLDGICVPDTRLERIQKIRKNSPPAPLGHAKLFQKGVVDARREINHRLSEPDDVVARALRGRGARPPSRVRR